MELRKLTLALCLLTSQLFALDFGDIPADTNVTTLWVAPSRTLTLSGVTLDLSANRTWTTSQLLGPRTLTIGGEAKDLSTDRSWTTAVILEGLGTPEQGNIIFRGATQYVLMSPGTDGYVLTTHGAGENPTWGAPGASTVDNTAFAASWDGVTTIAPSKNAVYDWGHTFDTNDNGKVNVLDQGTGIAVTNSGGVLQTPLTAPSGDIVGTTDVQHLQNKRITARGLGIVSSATPTINTDLYDVVSITALATNITSMTSGLSGTPNDFDKLIIRIKDLGGPWTITWGASFVDSGATLPTTTAAGKVTTVGLMWDNVKAKWVCLATDQEP